MTETDNDRDEDLIKQCPNCLSLNIADPDDETEFWMCLNCETLIDADGEFAYI